MSSMDKTYRLLDNVIKSRNRFYVLHNTLTLPECRILRSTRYLLHTRPDLAFSAGMVSIYMEEPTANHIAAVKILQYVKATLNFEWKIRKESWCWLVTLTVIWTRNAPKV